jgi:hypothetical protein
MDDQDLIDLLELQRLTREFLDHLMAMFSLEEAGDLLLAKWHDARRAVRARGLASTVKRRAEVALMTF